MVEFDENRLVLLIIVHIALYTAVMYNVVDIINCTICIVLCIIAVFDLGRTMCRQLNRRARGFSNVQYYGQDFYQVFCDIEWRTR